MLTNEVIKTELYEATIGVEGNTITIVTPHGHDAARRFAEFEVDRLHVSISVVFFVEEANASRAYVFRLRNGGCMEDTNTHTPNDRYADMVNGGRDQGGCPHSRRGSPSKCSLCVAAAEKAELVRLIKAGKL